MSKKVLGRQLVRHDELGLVMVGAQNSSCQACAHSCCSNRQWVIPQEAAAKLQVQAAAQMGAVACVRSQSQ